jgi:hypothetical protein
MGKADLDVAIVRDNLAYMIERFSALPRPALPDSGYCDEMANASISYRRCGIARLLTAADRDGFLDDLRRSAELRCDLLALARGKERDEDFARYISATRHRLGPFLDAVASGQLGLARAIALASDAPYDVRYEYEDDYCYAQVLFEAVKSGFAASPAIAPHMIRFDSVIDGEPTPRFQACRGLLAGDEVAFGDALQALIAAHAEEYREKGRGILADPEDHATERFILVEGLALKVIATRMNIPVSAEDRYMPREAFVELVP